MQTTAKKDTKRQEVIKMIKANDGVKEEEYKGLLIFTYDNKNGMPTTAVFGRKGHKPLSWYNFRNEDDRTNFLLETKKRQDYVIESELRDQAKWEAERAKVVVDSVLVSTWGYEQTNVDFYQVTGRKGDWVWLRPIQSKKSYDNGFNDRGSCTPVKDAFCGPEFRKKLDKWGGVSFSSYQSGILWDGREVSWSSYA